MEVIATIKNGAMNKAAARTCIQRRDLAQYGFECGQLITITFNPDAIHIEADPTGSKKVSCVNDKRRGFVYQTIDIRYCPSVRDAMFGSSAKLEVLAEPNLLIIRKAR